jgi:hypothetical protein
MISNYHNISKTKVSEDEFENGVMQTLSGVKVTPEKNMPLSPNNLTVQVNN